MEYVERTRSVASARARADGKYFFLLSTQIATRASYGNVVLRKSCNESFILFYAHVPLARFPRITTTPRYTSRDIGLLSCRVIFYRFVFDDISSIVVSDTLCRFFCKCCRRAHFRIICLPLHKESGVDRTVVFMLVLSGIKIVCFI